MKNVTENISLLKFLEQDYSPDNLNTSILNNIDAFIFLFDVQLVKPVWLNEFFFKRLKYTYEDLMNLTTERFFRMLNPKSLEQLTDRIKSIENQQLESMRSIYQVKTKDDQWVYMLISSRIFKKNPDGSPKYLLGFATEVEKGELNRHLKKLKELDNRHADLSLLSKLSSREVDVVRLITKGMTDKEIADKLQISIHTTKTHRKRIISKLGLKNTAALVKFAVENGII
jgi:DNA-binding CsgD family transcriptional regulator